MSTRARLDQIEKMYDEAGSEQHKAYMWQYIPTLVHLGRQLLDRMAELEKELKDREDELRSLKNDP